MDIITPVGRILSHAIFTPNTKGFNGEPLARPEYYVKLAIPKTDPGWPAFRDALLAEARQAFPKLVFSAGPDGAPRCNLPSFSFKVIDGDSAELDSSMKAPKDKPGHAGHWVIKLSTGFPTPVFNASGVPMSAEQVQCGHYYKLNASIVGGKNEQKPGVYLNLNGTLFVREGEVIEYVKTYESMFGGTSGAAVAPPPAAAAVTPPPPAHDILTPPPSDPVLKNTTATYKQMVAAGWTDDLLKQHGYL